MVTGCGLCLKPCSPSGSCLQGSCLHSLESTTAERRCESRMPVGNFLLLVNILMTSRHHIHPLSWKMPPWPSQTMLMLPLKQLISKKAMAAHSRGTPAPPSNLFCWEAHFLIQVHETPSVFRISQLWGNRDYLTTLSDFSSVTSHCIWCGILTQSPRDEQDLRLT